MCYRTVRKSDNDHGRVMCGIVLDEPAGRNDGTYGINKYFDCDPGHGLYCKVDKVTLLAEWNTPRERVRRALRKKAKDESMNQAGELAPSRRAQEVGGVGVGEVDRQGELRFGTTVRLNIMMFRN